MLVTRLGEFGLIRRIQRALKTDSSVVKGSGDDCAVIRFDRNRYLLFTCDMIMEGVDFSSSEDPFLIGRKALAVSVSDIAACAGLPRYCLVSLGLPRNTPVASIDKILKGMLSIARRYNINIVGGDISRADRLVLDVSMLGVVKKKNLVLRSGARVGDAICVTGSLGGSRLSKHLKFMPRVSEARFLVEHCTVHSMIDISDGLIQDLGHILKASRVGAIVYEHLIPLAPEAHSINEAMYGGEDFELLFTLPQAQATRLALKNPRKFKVIGSITNAKRGITLIDEKGRERLAKQRGFQHF